MSGGQGACAIAVSPAAGRVEIASLRSELRTTMRAGLINGGRYDASVRAEDWLNHQARKVRPDV